MATVTITVPNTPCRLASSGKFAVPTRSMRWRHESRYSASTTLCVRAPMNLRLGSFW